MLLDQKTSLGDKGLTIGLRAASSVSASLSQSQPSAGAFRGADLSGVVVHFLSSWLRLHRVKFPLKVVNLLRAAIIEGN